MADLSELKAKYEAIKADLPNILSQVATSVSLSGKALAERTIKDKGFGEMYSNTKVPAWFMTGKELNASGKNFIDRKKKDKELTNWKEFREAQGLQTGVVDLSYSNEMWSGMFPQEPYQQGERFIAPLGHNNKAGQDKMNWNRDRYGDFVGKALTGDNFDKLANVATEETMRLINDRHGLGFNLPGATPLITG